jgi:hypothetical protein
MKLPFLPQQTSTVSSQYFGEIVVVGGFDTCPPEGTPGQVWQAVPG